MILLIVNNSMSVVNLDKVVYLQSTMFVLLVYLHTLLEHVFRPNIFAQVTNELNVYNKQPLWILDSTH